MAALQLIKTVPTTAARSTAAVATDVTGIKMSDRTTQRYSI